jgi:hypothetical protein
MVGGTKPLNRAAYMEANSIPEPNSGCLLWLGTTSYNGPGNLRPVVNFGGRRDYVYRHAWREANGPIPAGLFVLHRCDVPLCINVAHLFLGDQAANMTDKMLKGRASNIFQSSKTHCRNGHPFTIENTRIVPDGKYSYRRCIICARIASSEAGKRSRRQ